MKITKLNTNTIEIWGRIGSGGCGETLSKLSMPKGLLLQLSRSPFKTEISVAYSFKFVFKIGPHLCGHSCNHERFLTAGMNLHPALAWCSELPPPCVPPWPQGEAAVPPRHTSLTIPQSPSRFLRVIYVDMCSCIIFNRMKIPQVIYSYRDPYFLIKKWQVKKEDSKPTYVELFHFDKK